MKMWITLVLALAATLPAAAQVGMGDEGSMPSTAPAMGANVAAADNNTAAELSQGTFVSHANANGNMPETVTLRYNWQGTPFLVTYNVQSTDKWMLQGQPINWAQVSQGQMIDIPEGALIANVSFGGASGVGKIESIDKAANTITFRVPDGSTSTLRFSPQALFIRNGEPTALSELKEGDDLFFEIPNSQNQIAAFSSVGTPQQGTITQVSDQSVTVMFPGDITRTYSLQGPTRFTNGGQRVAQGLSSSFQNGQTVWVYGDSDSPSLVASNVGSGFEVASIATPAEAVAGTRQEVTTPAPMDLSQGTFQSYTPAQGDRPATVTVRFDWNGTPLLGTYQVQNASDWMSQGQAVDFGQLQQGATLSIPQSARLVNLTFGGPMGVGTISSIDRTNNTVTLQLPNGDMRTLRYSPNAIFIQNGQTAMLSSLSAGQTVYFEIPPQGNMVALFSPVGEGVQGTITAVNDNGITVQQTVGGQTVTRNYPLNDSTYFINGGQMVAAADFATTFHTGDTVWVYGPADNPQIVATGVNTGFESAMVETPTTTAQTPGTTVTTTTVATMAPPFNQGVLVNYTPASDTTPALATLRFDWNGTPLLGTFTVQPNDQWMSQGQLVSLADLQAGATVTVPEGARIANLTFGGAMGVGTITSINRTNNTIAVRLPNGQARTLRYSPQAVVLSNGQPATFAQLEMGQPVLFEVAPGTNRVALFTPVQAGSPATVTQVSENTLTIRQMVNGQPVTRTYSTDQEIPFINNGQPVSVTDFRTAYQPGQTVYVYGPAESPQLVASGVTTGYEVAVVSPAPSSAVAGTRQEVTRPATRRPARRVAPGK